MSNNYQRGNAPRRLEWVEEQTEGQTPADPDWKQFSEHIISGPGWEPDPNVTRAQASGEATASGFYNGAETHSVTYTYFLQQWYNDGNGNPQDPGYYFLQPSGSNSLRGTLSILDRAEYVTGGNDGAGYRVYTVIRGAHPDSLTAPFETEDGTPIEQELAFQAEKIRQFTIHQPSSSTTLDIENTGTTSVDVTVEDDDASTAETVTVAGGSTSTTTATFSSLDAVSLSDDIGGDIIVSDGSGTTLVTVKGSDAYAADEGDLGVPALGSGSRASDISGASEPSYIRFIDDELSIPNVDSDVEIISGEMSVETGLNSNPNTGDARLNIHATTWTYTLTATLAGPHTSVDQTTNQLTETTGTVTWTAQEGSIDFNNAYIQSPGEYTREAGNGKLQLDNEFEAETVTVN